MKPEPYDPEARWPFPAGYRPDEPRRRRPGEYGWRWWPIGAVRCIICDRLVDDGRERCDTHADPVAYPAPWPSELT